MRNRAQLAIDLLIRVVADAAGTSWAMMAARELQCPFGIRVEETAAAVHRYESTR